MSKQIAVIPRSRIKKISVLLGEGRSLAQIRQDADFVMNGGFYDMRTGKPVGHLKVNGQVLGRADWNTWGFRWNEGADIGMDVVPDGGGENYISGVELLTPAAAAEHQLHYPTEIGGKRGRTALALAGKDLILYCSEDGSGDASTPEALRRELTSMGATAALLLDGGGSSQCDFQGKGINSLRRVHNYLAVWLKQDVPKVEGEKQMKKVVLDPGHGVETVGKCSPDGSFREHEFNLDMARRVQALLERHGVSVILTRSSERDVSLQERVKTANEAAPDLFVSLHSNASGDGSGWTQPRGYGIYTSAPGETAGRNRAAKGLLERAGEEKISLWGNGLYHDISLYVLKQTKAPAILIEHGFHTNREEVELLKRKDYRERLARVDARGILEYLGMDWVEEQEEEVCVGAVCPHCGGALKIGKG